MAQQEATLTPTSTPRVVLVTGANRGIGRAIAERFVAAGDKVATIYRSGDLPVRSAACDGHRKA